MTKEKRTLLLDRAYEQHDDCFVPCPHRQTFCISNGLSAHDCPARRIEWHAQQKAPWATPTEWTQIAVIALFLIGMFLIPA